MLEKINLFMQRRMAILTPLSLLLGVLLAEIGQQLVSIVPILFAIMTFISSLNMKLKDAKVFIKYPKTILFSIAFLHILMPVWAYFLSTLFFNDHLLTIGYVMAVAVPTGVTSVIWVTMSKGNLPLCLAIILIDTLLAPIIMPSLLHLVVGEHIAIDTMALMLDLVWMVVLPSIAGIIVNEVSEGKVQQRFGKKLAPFSKLCLFLVIMINSSVIAPYLNPLTWELAAIILVVLLVSVSGYVFALILGRFLWKDPSITATFVFMGGMRNIAAGVVIATTYFPGKVVMPVVLGMLFQQVLASFFSKIVRKNFGVAQKETA